MSKSNIIPLFLEPVDYKVEAFYFFDPFSESSLEMEAIINKLLIEYKGHLHITKVLAPSLQILTKCQAQSTSNHDNIALAYKAAEVQGRLKARKFMRYLFNRITPTNGLCTKEMIEECAGLSGLDMNAFKEEINSENLHILLERDLALYRELDITELPTFVFFSGDANEEGLKIEGSYDYYVYAHIIHEMLGVEIQKKALPNISDYIKKNELVSFRELKTIYDWREGVLLKELKKLEFAHVINRIKLVGTDYYKIRQTE